MVETEIFYMAFFRESTSSGSNLHSLLIHPAGLLLIKKKQLSCSAFCFIALILFSADHLLK